MDVSLCCHGVLFGYTLEIFPNYQFIHSTIHNKTTEHYGTSPPSDTSPPPPAPITVNDVSHPESTPMERTSTNLSTDIEMGRME
jgi:hypothetical protein